MYNIFHKRQLFYEVNNGRGFWTALRNSKIQNILSHIYGYLRIYHKPQLSLWFRQLKQDHGLYLRSLWSKKISCTLCKHQLFFSHILWRKSLLNRNFMYCNEHISFPQRGERRQPHGIPTFFLKKVQIPQARPTTSQNPHLVVNLYSKHLYLPPCHVYCLQSYFILGTSHGEIRLS